MDIVQLISDVGFPIASALAGGFFVFLTLKFILDGVLSEIKAHRALAQALDNRIKTMNNEVMRIDIMLCHSYGVNPDMNRMSRVDDASDLRKD